MTIEQSNGKARPTLPRAKDLALVDPDAVPEPSEGRAEAGRFAHGNLIAVGRGWKHAISKTLGRDAGDDDKSTVARDAWKLYHAMLLELPHRGAIVRVNVARAARAFAVAGYLDSKADEAGLDTDRGMLLADKAASHGQRAERHSVTAIDLSTKLSGGRRKGNAVEALKKKIDAKVTRTQQAQVVVVTAPQGEGT